MKEHRVGVGYVIKLAEKLREYSEWAEANQWEVPISLPDDLADAASIIEELTDVVFEGRVCRTCLHDAKPHTAPVCVQCDSNNCNWEWKGVNVRV